MNEETRILEAIGGGDAQATEDLLPIVYEELRHLAAQKLSKEPRGHTTCNSPRTAMAVLGLFFIDRASLGRIIISMVVKSNFLSVSVKLPISKFPVSPISHLPVAQQPPRAEGAQEQHDSDAHTHDDHSTGLEVDRLVRCLSQ